MSTVYMVCKFDEMTEDSEGQEVVYVTDDFDKAEEFYEKYGVKVFLWIEEWKMDHNYLYQRRTNRWPS